MQINYMQIAVKIRSNARRRGPFVIAKIKSHDLAKRTVNHVRPNYSMNYTAMDNLQGALLAGRALASFVPQRGPFLPS
jgi:hypothetical protein